jgi:glycosyltransferase involved in cell wall biosynthesis
MRILQICHSYYPPFLDCARQYAALVEGKPYKMLTVYLTGDADDEVAKKSHSDEVIFLGFKSKEVSGLKLKAIAKIKEIVKKEQFLFCIAHRTKPTYLALLATNLQVISVHHAYNDYSRWSRRLLVNFHQKRLLILGVSDSVRDNIRRDLGSSWPSEKIQTLYNRIDVKATQASMVSKEAARQYLDLPSDALVIGNVGRLHSDKDQATLIRGFKEALPSLPKECLLFIAGKGPLEEELKLLIISLNLSSKVIMAGNVPDAKHYFKAFDVFVLTSYRETFGMVLVEAMAAGVPIICSRCGGPEEVVNGIGQLFPFGDINELSKAMKSYFDINHDLTVNQDAIERLSNTFSDTAVRSVFWKLSEVELMVAKT